jgi:hypothetical protein
MRRWLLCSVLGLGALIAAGACGEDEESCQGVQGVICNDCAADPGCNITCAAGELETCVGLEYFSGENPDDLRCAFCQ